MNSVVLDGTFKGYVTEDLLGHKFYFLASCGHPVCQTFTGLAIVPEGVWDKLTPEVQEQIVRNELCGVHLLIVGQVFFDGVNFCVYVDVLDIN